MDGQHREGFFRTAPPATADSLSFYAYGDSRSNPRTHDALAGQLLANVANDAERRQTFLLHGGDFVTRGLGERYWDQELFNPHLQNVQATLAQMPILGALGNHEEYPVNASAADCQFAGQIFRKYWPYPLYVEEGHFYYSFDYGPVHVAVIDPYTADYTKGTSAQYRWLQKDLAQPHPWKVVLLHPPAWSYGRNSYPLRQNLHELFRASGVDAVVQGHNHYYARLDVDGIPYLTLGGGGADLNAPSQYDPRSFDDDRGGLSGSCVRVPFVADSTLPEVAVVDLKTAASVYHFARFDIAGGRMTIAVIDKDGKLIDCVPTGAICLP
jgi:hypothetical protein